MNKLLITKGVDFLDYQEWLRFDIRSNDLNENRFASLKVKQSSEMTPYNSVEVEKDMIISGLCSVIDLLKSYLEQIQRGQ